MAYHLDEIVPWGRSFEEYLAMFALAPEDLRSPVLGCGDGPASFNAVLTARGGSCISVDPLYQFSSTAIAARIETVRAEVIRQTSENAHQFVWTHFHDVRALVRARNAAMTTFLADYGQGRRAGRYLPAALPCLPFRQQHFGLALCSHLLFLYGAHLDLPFHESALLELGRVAEEVRVFPTLQLDGAVWPHLAQLLPRLEARGFQAELRQVPYEFQRGGHTMLVVRRA